MCGIFGYIGGKNPLKTVLNGLKKLEYRGYDSAGIAGIKDNKIYFWKEVGKVSELERAVEQKPVPVEVAISQTRWATHGGVTKPNAHPHLDGAKSIAVVHNGIIENFQTLKMELQSKGVEFLSETDTEVIAHLIAENYKGDFAEAVQKTVKRLQGAYSLAILHANHPDTIIAIANEAPLVIGIGKNEAFVSSDYHAFAFETREVIYLSHGEIAEVKKDKVSIFNKKHERVHKDTITLDEAREEISKGDFSHYTLKEIFEQPSAIRSALAGRFILDYGSALFEDIAHTDDLFKNIGNIIIIGCGTSYHAGYVGAYMIEEIAGIPVHVEIGSEYRYKNPIVPPDTLVIAISQSGETADTIAAMRELKTKGAQILALTNVYASTISREADATIFLKAGVEIGVCSTKAFTSQLTVLSLITLLLGRLRKMSKDEGIKFLNALLMIPVQVEEILNSSAQIERCAKKYAQYENFFFLGRNYMFPTALEGALKLKEISYINANGYPAGEMKHGPIALISPDCPTVALCANKALFNKTVSNLMEVKAREGKIIAIAERDSESLEGIAEDILWVPKTLDCLAPILSTIVTQLFAFYIALERGADIDQPRNLAKSVTVE